MLKLNNRIVFLNPPSIYMATYLSFVGNLLAETHRNFKPWWVEAHFWAVMSMSACVLDSTFATLREHRLSIQCASLFHIWVLIWVYATLFEFNHSAVIDVWLHFLLLNNELSTCVTIPYFKDKTRSSWLLLMLITT